MSDDLEIPEGMQTKGSKLDEEAKDELDELSRTIYDELCKFDREGKSAHLSVRDDDLGAVIRALEAHDAVMIDVANTLRSELGLEAEETTNRSDLLRLALRFAFQNTAPDVMAARKEAHMMRFDHL
ncbi:hypothetical protein ACNS7O_18785 (plasmid) [Haloferacaceae archaeon DSL9]